MGKYASVPTYTFKSGDTRTICHKVIKTQGYVPNVAFNFSNAESIIIPDDIPFTEFDFHQCDNLSSITIPDGDGFALKGISSTAWGNAQPNNSALYIGDHFVGIKGQVTNIAIKEGTKWLNGIVTIKLGAITIPDSVSHIPQFVFSDYWCKPTSVTMGSGVTVIDSDAFGIYSGLTSVTIDAVTPPTVASFYNEEGEVLGLFDHFSNGERVPNDNLVIRVPQGSVDAYKAADVWKRYADSIVANS